MNRSLNNKVALRKIEAHRGQLLATLMLAGLVMVCALALQPQATQSTTTASTDASMVDVSAIDIELMQLLKHPLKETADNTATVNPEVTLPVRISLPLSVKHPEKTSYSFSTSMGAPEEPVIYTLNGNQITVDEFYDFQRELALQNYRNQIVAEQLQTQQRKRMLTSLVASTDLEHHLDIESELEKKGRDVVVHLNSEQILAIAKNSPISGLKLYYAGNDQQTELSETLPENSSSSDLAKSDLRNGIVFLLISLICAYLMAYCSLRNLRTKT